MINDKKVLLSILASSLLVNSFVVYGLAKKPENLVKQQVEEPAENNQTTRLGLQIIYSGKETSLSAKIDTDSSIFDLMENLRKKNQISYDLVNYTSGEVIETVNSIENNKNSGFMWNLYLNNNRLTGNIRETKIVKNGLYKLIYERNNEPTQ